MVAVVGAHILDAHSSQGRYELNPLLRNTNGTFSPRKAILVKSASSAGFLLLGAILVKKRHGPGRYKPFITVNATTAGVIALNAGRNYTIRRVNRPDYLLRDGMD